MFVTKIANLFCCRPNNHADCITPGQDLNWPITIGMELETGVVTVQFVQIEGTRVLENGIEPTANPTIFH